MEVVETTKVVNVVGQMYALEDGMGEQNGCSENMETSQKHFGDLYKEKKVLHGKGK